MGEYVFVKKGTTFYSPTNIEVGSFVNFGDDCSLNGHSGLKIGNFVRFASNVSVITNIYKFDDWRIPQY